MDVQLPKWAQLSPIATPRPVINVDAQGAYSALLAELKPADAELDQYWLEVAYQCIKLELQLAMRSLAFEIRIHDAGKKFAQADYPEGRGARAAAQGREAREHFRRIRGFIPG